MDEEAIHMSATSASKQPSAIEKTLYARMGGYDVIAAVIDELFARLRQDPRFERFSAGRSIDSFRRARQLLVDQMCALAGGPCVYIGRGMKTSHEGLGISEAEWDANMRHTQSALQKFGVAEAEQREFMEFFNRYKAEIVEGPGSSKSAHH
jgi:hemoglobin